eukprot:554916-Rhodomonas_salina.1
MTCSPQFPSQLVFVHVVLPPPRWRCPYLTPLSDLPTAVEEFSTRLLYGRQNQRTTCASSNNWYAVFSPVSGVTSSRRPSGA